MYGVVRFRTHRGEPAEAILDERGHWQCPRLPVLNRVLNILYAPERVAVPGLSPEAAALLRVANWLKGTVSSRVERNGILASPVNLVEACGSPGPLLVQEPAG